MNGKAEIHRLRSALDATFLRANGLLQSDLELQSDFAKYLCVLVSGFVDRAIVELVLDLARRQSSEKVQRLIGSRFERLNNFNAERLLQMAGSIDATWRVILESKLDDNKDAINSILNNRNAIAHGNSVGITIARVKSYYSLIKVILEDVTDLFYQ